MGNLFLLQISKQMKYSMMCALLGLAAADHCNVDKLTYTSTDCSGTATSALFMSMIKKDECFEGKDYSMMHSECSSSKLTYSVWTTKDCSGTKLGPATLAVGTCIKGSSGSTKYVLADGAAAKAVAWASVTIAMLAAHV